MKIAYGVSLAILLCMALSSCANLTPTQAPPAQLTQKVTPELMQKLMTTLAEADDNQTTTWQNADGSILYQLISQAIYINGQGYPCRAYQLQIRQNYQRPWMTQGTACRNDDGQWQTIT